MERTRTRKPFMRLLSAVTAISSAACMLPAMPGLSAAAASYDLTVGGVTVTSTNAADILGDGVFSYKASTKTLTVKGVNETQDSNIISYINGLTINVTASSILRSSENIALNLNGDTTITGSESLNVIADEGIGIYCAGTLAFDNAKVMVSGLYALSGSADDSAKLFIEDSAVFVDSLSGNPAISDFNGGISFDDESRMTRPESWDWYGWDYNYHDGTIYDYYEEYDDYVDCRVADRVVFGSVETYPFTVAGMTVTDLNKDDILGDGTFSYVNYDYYEDEDGNCYEEYNTLHVHGDCTVTEGNVIDNYDAYGLRIVIDSDSRFTVTGDAESAIRINTNTDIYGPGKLTIESDAIGIYQPNYCDLYISEADITIRSVGAGMKGESGYVIINRTNLDVASSEDFAIYGFNNGFSLPDSYITAPANAKQMSDGVYVGTTPCTACTIKAVEYYDLWVCDVHVTSGNNSDILGNGVLSYDPDSNTLNVNKKADYDYSNGTFIYNRIHDLTFNVAYDLNLEDNYLHLCADTKITGNGKLTINSSAYAIGAGSGSTLTIQDANLDLTSCSACISGDESGEKLVIINSTIQAKMQEGYWDCCIRGFDNGIVFQDCYVSEPEDIEFDSSIHLENGDYVRSLTIVPGPTMVSYDLWIAGKRVKSTNADDILGDGVFSYDEESNTLTVNKATTYYFRYLDLDDIILNNINDLTINLAADLTIDCNYEVVHTTKNLTITGSGKLTVTSYNAPIEVWDNATLTIKDANMNLSGSHGIIGDWDYEWGNSSSKLIIINSAIQIQTQYGNQVAIAGFSGGVELQNCWFSDPENAHLNENGIIVYDDEWDNTYYAGSITILPGPKPSITQQPADVSGTIDSTVQLTINTEGNDLTYQWQYYNTPTKKWVNATGDTAKSKTFKLTVTAADNGRKYRCVVTKPNGSELISDSATVTVNPKITAQPQNTSAKIGETAQFSVSATGVGLIYQWQVLNTATNKWENTSMTGNQTETLSVPVDANSNGKKFHCIVKDRNSTKVTSAAAVLTIDPAILTQPKTASGTIGSTVTFTVEANGAGLTYQWQYFNTTSNKWENTGLTGNKTATLSVTVNSSRHNMKYRCVISDANGNQLTSSAATLKVLPKITAQPENASGVIGDSVTFSVAATGIGLTYQWQYFNTTTNNWENTSLTGNKTNTLKVTVNGTRNKMQYHCVITDINGKQLTSNPAALIVNPKITAQPQNASATAGDKVTFTVSATGVGLTYQWQYFNTASNKWENTGLAGNKTATLTVTATSDRNGMKYHCIVKDTNGTKLTSSAAVLTVNAKITAQPQNFSGCIGDTAKFTVAAAGPGLIYQWQYFNTSTNKWENTGLTGNKTATLSVQILASRNGYKYHCIVKDANGTKLTSDAAALTVNAKITAQPADVSAALSDTAKFTVTATGIGLTYQWQYFNTTTDKWENTSLAGNKTATLSVTALTSRNNMQYHCIVKDSAGNTLTSDAATLKIIPKITAQPQSVSAAAGSTAKFTVTATGIGLVYQWQYYNTSTKKWENTGLAGNKTATLSVTAISSRNGMKYHCIVKDSAGNKLTSTAATLTVE